jgi:hypothetical protein
MRGLRSCLLPAARPGVAPPVVKDEQYPGPIRAPLMRPEAEGVLNPCASQIIEIREGNVIRGKPGKELITLVCLKQ